MFISAGNGIPAKVVLASPAPGEGVPRAIRIGEHTTPLGVCRIALAGDRVCYLGFVEEGGASSLESEVGGVWPGTPLERDPEGTAAMMEAVFCGRSGAITVLLRGTDFQMRVWPALLEIPPGSLVTYGKLAGRVGCPGGARAAGQAVGANPVAVLIPCHRVVGSDGRLGGYRWGAEIKRALLLRERAGSLPD